MFDIGMPELIVIFIVALLVLGPKKLPELARAIGKGLGELKRALQDAKDKVETEFEEATSDIRETLKDTKKQLELDVKQSGKTIDSTLKDVKKQVESESEEIRKSLENSQGSAKDEKKRQQ
jgi:Tat protein translocase TatB subunit